MSNKRRIDIQFQEGESDAVRLKKLRALVEELSRVQGGGGGGAGGGAQGPQGPPGPEGPAGVIQSIIAGTNVSIDSTDPANPIISATGGGGGGVSVEISDTAPIGPDVGDLWWDSVNGILMLWYDDGDTQQWVSVMPAGSGGGGGSSYFPSGW